jgi:hypothetical protein
MGPLFALLILAAPPAPPAPQTGEPASTAKALVEIFRDQTLHVTQGAAQVVVTGTAWSAGDIAALDGAASKYPDVVVIVDVAREAMPDAKEDTILRGLPIRETDDPAILRIAAKTITRFQKRDVIAVAAGKVIQLKGTVYSGEQRTEAEAGARRFYETVRNRVCISAMDALDCPGDK